MTSRGNAYLPIYDDDPDRKRFLDILGEKSNVRKIELALKETAMIGDIPMRERLAYRSDLEDLLSVKNIANKSDSDRLSGAPIWNLDMLWLRSAII